ncbi:putative homocysteine S-methyltransferase [Rosa chinensis]|uniref:Putative homocysteine S-methyltransferase n=1 Tax=Rosa chinensis TaxID=74649 RepID=A0A2P6QPC6_ROSCH|nr:putative homocysteine S-methyltransferase [Rosa chinensis]
MGLGSEVKTSSFMSDFLEKCGGCALLDGRFATELERHGADLNDPLRSAKCLVSSPPLVRRVHLDYLDAGANIIITASYHATIQGFEAKGFSKEEAKALLRKSVEIAIEAREIYFDKCTKGSWDFVDAGKPSRHPVLAYAELLEEEAIDIPAWFTFASKDGIDVVSGDSIFECASIANACKQVVAVGINCTPPRFIQGLNSSIRKVTSKPIVIYPNSGETYDGQSKQWIPSSGRVDEEFAEIVIEKWREAGASLFGGCCRTTPNTIRAISKALSNKSSAVNDA